MAPGAHRERGDGRAEQGRTTEDVHLASAEPQRQQVGGQQHRHVAVREGTQGATRQQRQAISAAGSHPETTHRPLQLSGEMFHIAGGMGDFADGGTVFLGHLGDLLHILRHLVTGRALLA